MQEEGVEAEVAEVVEVLVVLAGSLMAGDREGVGE